MADEPTGNLDSKTGKEIMDLFKSLNEEGQTIVMVTHNPENTSFSTRTISLKDGRVETGSVASLKMKSDYPLASDRAAKYFLNGGITMRRIECHRRPPK